MHGISMNSSLEIDLLSLRKYNIQRQQGQGQGQGYLLWLKDDFSTMMIFSNHDDLFQPYRKLRKLQRYLYIFKVLSSSSLISL